MLRYILMNNKFIGFFLIMLLIGCSSKSADNKRPLPQSLNQRINNDTILGHGNVWDSRIIYFDKDNKLDLVCISKDEKVFIVFDILGARKTTLLSTKCIHPVSLASADFNNDGKTEIVLQTESGLHSYLSTDDKGTVKEKTCTLKGDKPKNRMWKAETVYLSNTPNRPGILSAGRSLLYFKNQGKMTFWGYEINVPPSPASSRAKLSLGRVFRNLIKIDDLNNDGINEFILLDYGDRTVWLLESNSKKSTTFEPLFMWDFQINSPSWATLLNKTSPKKWLIMTDSPGTIWLLTGEPGEKITVKSILKMNRRFAGTVSTDLNGDSCPDIIIFAESQQFRKPGELLIYNGICKDNSYSLAKAKVIKSNLLTTYAMTYKDPILVIPGFEKKIIEIYVKGRDL